MTGPDNSAPVSSGDNLVSIEDFARVDLRTAKILAVREHPNADKLYLLTVEVGPVTKQIVAGIRSFFTPDQLLGATIIIVNNLKPAKLRGETSEGMLLAIRTPEGGLTLATTRDIVQSGLKLS